MLKRGAAVLLALLMVLILIPASRAAQPIGYAVVHNPDPADRLNLRKTASVDAASLGRYYNGTQVAILAWSGEWAQVMVGGKDGDIAGYMQAKYLNTSNKRDEVPPAFPSYRHAGRLALYDDPSLKYVRSTFSSATVQVMGFTDAAWHVLVNDVTGFIKPGDKSLVARADASDMLAVVNNPDPADRLNLRKEASSASVSLYKYYNGTQVTVLENVNAEWARVKIGNLTGYMQRRFLAVGTAADSVLSAMPRYLCQSDTLEGYESPALKGSHVTYGYLQTFKLMGYSDRCWHILIDDTGETCFVSAANNYSAYHVGAVSNPNPFDRLHIRQQKSDTSPSFGEFYNGLPLYVLGVNPSAKGWAQVICHQDGFAVSGYAKTKCLALDEEAVRVTPVYPLKELAAEGGAEVVLGAFFFEKRGDGLGAYPSGTKVRLVGVGRDHVFVEVDGKIGVVAPDEIK